MSLIDQIPGLGAAIEQERFVRDSSFLSLPEVIGGVDVQPMTLRHVIALSSVGSPFIAGGHASPEAVAQFVLLLAKPQGWLAKRRLLRRIARLDYDATIAEIKAFMDEAFQDSPASSGGRAQASYYSFAASLVDVFGTEYGWSENEILDVPLKRLFQYLNAIRKRHNPEAVLFNPSDRVRGEFLAAVNKKN